MACARILHLHLSNPAPSLHFTAPWCWCRCWQPQAPSQAPSSAPLPTLPNPHPNTSTARSCPPPGPPRSRADFAALCRLPESSPWPCTVGIRASELPPEQPPARHRATNPALPFPTTLSSLRRAGAPLPGALCSGTAAQGGGTARAELLARRAQPAGHGETRTHQSFLGIAEAEQQRRQLRAPPLHRDAQSSAARLLASCTCRYVPALPSPELGRANPWLRCQGYQSPSSSDAPPLQCLLILSSFKSLRHIHGCHRN